jgi:hypothetical protein
MVPRFVKQVGNAKEDRDLENTHLAAIAIGLKKANICDEATGQGGSEVVNGLKILVCSRYRGFTWHLELVENEVTRNDGTGNYESEPITKKATDGRTRATGGRTRATGGRTRATGGRTRATARRTGDKYTDLTLLILFLTLIAQSNQSTPNGHFTPTTTFHETTSPPLPSPISGSGTLPFGQALR